MLGASGRLPHVLPAKYALLSAIHTMPRRASRIAGCACRRDSASQAGTRTAQPASPTTYGDCARPPRASHGSTTSSQNAQLAPYTTVSTAPERPMPAAIANPTAAAEPTVTTEYPRRSAFPNPASTPHSQAAIASTASSSAAHNQAGSRKSAVTKPASRTSAVASRVLNMTGANDYLPSEPVFPTEYSASAEPAGS